ncbi:MAG: hypothetical protein HYU64_11910 [Armatimonadetes bacterium]|nr:hypothetical protein [Armatimonadota bacterium]
MRSGVGLFLFSFATLGAIFLLRPQAPAVAYPGTPMNDRKLCAECHKSTGAPWKQDDFVIDIVDPKTGESFKTRSGDFVIPVKQGQARLVKGYYGVKGTAPEPYKIGWAYLSPGLVYKGPLESPKFADGWTVSRHYCTKYPEKKKDRYKSDHITFLSMGIRPNAGVGNTDLNLYVVVVPAKRGLGGAGQIVKKVRLTVEGKNK